ncbi:MAG: hypothetical protein ACRYFV_15715 [Janthinobacterium lividum]
MAFQKAKTHYPAATEDANGLVTIPGLGAGNPAKILARIGATATNQVGKVLELTNPFPKPAVIIPPVVVTPPVVVMPPPVTVTSIGINGSTQPGVKSQSFLIAARQMDAILSLVDIPRLA